MGGGATKDEFRTAIPYVVVVCGLLLSPLIAAADPSFEIESRGADRVEVAWDLDVLRQQRDVSREFEVAGFPLPDGEAVDLALTRFDVTGPDVRFVVGRRGKDDVAFGFDPSRLLFFRGTVRGRPGSSVLIGLGEKHASGHLDLGPGLARYRISGAGDPSGPRSTTHATIFRADAAAAMPPAVPFCGVERHLDLEGRLDPPFDEPNGLAAAGPVRHLRQLELAVETDYEFFELFGNLDDAATYLVALYAAVSDIYARDVNTRVELVYARLWDDPDDLFNIVDPSPLSDFQSYWNTNMGGVSRDVAQLLSGRRDYPFGGQAWVSSLCGGSAYSVVGYASGAFPDPDRPSPYHYDISVTAHELGHNAGTYHTHDSPNNLDSCNDPETIPQRGTIMSYCGQTWSGGNSNRDHYFHGVIRQNMLSHIGGASCVVADCNLNSIDDSTDVQSATSPDLNGNDVPDECEDCNQNTVLDDVEISLGTSLDLNGNQIPDECEADCNDNEVPDDLDIAGGTSPDAYGNRIPDECEVDCNGNDVSDYVEIQADMPSDVDRDAVLDACQDCDGDGTRDHLELGGAHNVWIASGLSPEPIRQFYASTGVLTRSSSGPGAASVLSGQDLIVSPSGTVWVTSAEDDRVMEFDSEGAYLGDFVSAGLGGLSHPTGLVVSPGGLLLVASRDTDEVLVFDAMTGTFQGALVQAGAGGLIDPFGLTYGPSGNLFVTSDAGEVLEYDGTSGAFVRLFVSTAASGGLDRPRGLTFKPDGNLLVASYGTNEVLEYDGQSGAALGKWAQAGTATRLTQVSPWGIRVGPNGNVFVVRTGEDYGSGGGGGLAHEHHDSNEHLHGSENVTELHLTNAQIYEYDVRNGNFLRAHVSGNDHGLRFPTGFAFVPGWNEDCNYNLFPDACDISTGASSDTDLGGTPDECEIDCNANGVLDRLDIVPFGSELDCNSNLVPDACDLASGTSGDCTGNGIPDECESDCNGNAVADSCDLASETSSDCNGNDVPDECDVTDNLEFTFGWSSGSPGDDASEGTWVRVNPHGTAAQPEFDHTPGGGRVCFVTGQGPISGAPEGDDVDGGRTTLLSPAFDLSGDPDPEIGYWRWFSNDVGANPSEDTLRVDISADGLAWTTVETVGPTGPERSGGWFFNRVRVADFVSSASSVRLRFVASDLGGDSVVEAAIDDIVLLPDCCLSPVEVAGVGFGAGAASRLVWLPQPEAVYDVAGGSLSTLHADGGVEAATCLADGVIDGEWEDPRPDPLPGDGYYYLVRSQKSCGSGSYGSSSSGVERRLLADCP
jgi:hypothetical protein